MEFSNNDDRTIANFSLDVPGVTYSLDNASTDFAEIDSNGILRLKSTASWDANENSSLEVKKIQ